MCNYNIWFDGFRCVLCGACADVCPEGVIHMIDINQMKSEGALPELVDAYGWSDGAAMVLDEERCIRCALCVKRCPYDAIPWSGSSFRRSAATGGSTRRATAIPSWGCLGSVTAPRPEDTFGELPRAGRHGHPPQRSVPLFVPPAVPIGRAIAFLRGHEQRLPAPAPGARSPARGQVRVHVLPRRPVVLLLPGADRYRRLPDVLLRALVHVR